MTYDKESVFEDALVAALTERYGWEKKVLIHPTEEDLYRNWADILFNNNREIDRLNGVPLSDGEMHQIAEQIRNLRTPLKLNNFINGKSISITRDNPADTLHFGKEISLKIYDRMEIAGGKSRYQIARQPEFKTPNLLASDRRGDVMLLINGMPVIHIELKRSGVDVSQAYNQIEKYANEHVFTGIFSLIQIFVAMNPEETVYFANPGPDGVFNKDFYFHWADFDNIPVNDWQVVAEKLLSIPMAHQMIGFYTVADSTDGVLKVMRSYQYFAATRISDRVPKRKDLWDGKNQRGGYIWHTTGSGKTMTSFKSAQLIADSQDADKVVFLMDRIELGTQSLLAYRGFAGDGFTVQATENTGVLVSKLKSSDPNNTLIVTSIQKMSNIKDEPEGMNARDLTEMRKKRIVFIVDECHRDTFGDMMSDIKAAFPAAIFFGFTGTPIHKENQKKMNTTASVFGDELHRYTITDGIRDKNVLGFDPYMVLTWKDKDIRQQVALAKARAKSEIEAMGDPSKRDIYLKYMNPAEVKMAGFTGPDGKYIKGIEDYLRDLTGTLQYDCQDHRQTVIQDIKDNWLRLSRAGKFHAIFATSSIQEAILYYRLAKKMMPELKITAQFDSSIDNSGAASAKEKEDGLTEILADYNQRYGQHFTIPTHDGFKKDVSYRLAHKEQYKSIHKTPELQLDLLIVVDQMLTGFDSKWVNTLYLDKLMVNEHIIQAFSRTNRLFGSDEKPFGTIRYYRFPHTMTRNIEHAVKLYSGDRPAGLFVEQLGHNLKMMNSLFSEIENLFLHAGIENFSKLPDELAERGQFAKLFKKLNSYLEAAKVQGFRWGQSEYVSDGEKITLAFGEETYSILLHRYKELFQGGGGGGVDVVPFPIDPHLMEIDTGVIDADYMNSRFEKYRLILEQEHVDEKEKQQILADLHKSFATLSLEEQKYANLVLHEFESGRIQMLPGKTFRDHITECQTRAKAEQFHRLAAIFGLDEKLLIDIMKVKVTESTINEFGRFQKLMASVNRAKAKAYFEQRDGVKLSGPKVIVSTDKLLRDFIFSGGKDIPEGPCKDAENKGGGGDAH